MLNDFTIKPICVYVFWISYTVRQSNNGWLGKAESVIPNAKLKLHINIIIVELFTYKRNNKIITHIHI